MLVPVGPFQILNHGHARKELEDYHDDRWLPSPILRHDLKGLIVMHFQNLGLAASYWHEVHPDDTFFEDTKVFEDSITRMRLSHILEERIDVLDQDPDLYHMGWRRRCFEVKPDEEKDEESDKDKENDEEMGK